jgi:hypothetical protein
VAVVLVLSVGGLGVTMQDNVDRNREAESEAFSEAFLEWSDLGGAPGFEAVTWAPLRRRSSLERCWNREDTVSEPVVGGFGTGGWRFWNRGVL